MTEYREVAHSSGHREAVRRTKETSYALGKPLMCRKTKRERHTHTRTHAQIEREGYFTACRNKTTNDDR